MSSATRSFNGLTFSKNSSGGTSRSTASPPRMYGAASIAVRQAISFVRSSAPASASSASASTASR